MVEKSLFKDKLNIYHVNGEGFCTKFIDGKYCCLKKSIDNLSHKCIRKCHFFREMKKILNDKIKKKMSGFTPLLVFVLVNK